MIDLNPYRRETAAKRANGFFDLAAQAANLFDVPARYWIIHFHIPLQP